MSSDKKDFCESDSLELKVPTSLDMKKIGQVIGENVQSGLLVMLDGPLGAGKTTLTQGIAVGLGIEERIQSPTFVIAMLHDNHSDRPSLLHVDAYRLESVFELDDLDLDALMEESVAVIEWGRGKVEVLSTDRLEIEVIRPVGGSAENTVEDLYEDSIRKLLIKSTGPKSQEVVNALKSCVK